MIEVWRPGRPPGERRPRDGDRRASPASARSGAAKPAEPAGRRGMSPRLPPTDGRQRPPQTAQQPRPRMVKVVERRGRAAAPPARRRADAKVASAAPRSAARTGRRSATVLSGRDRPERQGRPPRPRSRSRPPRRQPAVTDLELRSAAARQGARPEFTLRQAHGLEGAARGQQGTALRRPLDRQRIDKWLWHARVVRTRSAAAALVERRHRPHQRRAYRRIEPPGARRRRRHRRARSHRAGAEGQGLCRAARFRGDGPRRCYEDLTPPRWRRKLPPGGVRDEGSGRPTKRERREIDRLQA